MCRHAWGLPAFAVFLPEPGVKRACLAREMQRLGHVGTLDYGLRKKQTVRSAALRAAEAGKPQACLPVFICVLKIR